MNEPIIAKQFVYLRMCLCAGCRDADTEEGREKERDASCFACLEENPVYGPTSKYKSSAGQRRLRCYLFFLYDTTFQSFCQG